MATLSENLRRVKNERAKARLMWEHYVSRQRTDNLEPKWIHPAYKLAREMAEGRRLDPNDITMFRQMIGSHELEDGTIVPSSNDMPTGVMHDGWRVGTTSWVFMGRKKAANIAGETGEKSSWVLVGRTIPKTIQSDFGDSIYIAYNLNCPVGMGPTDWKANVVGPAASVQEVIGQLETSVQVPMIAEVERIISRKPSMVHDGQHRYRGK